MKSTDQAPEEIAVDRRIGRKAIASFRVEYVSGHPVVREVRIVEDPDGVREGLDAAVLRDAVVIRGVLEEARTRMRSVVDDWSGAVPAWRSRMGSDPEAEFMLCLLGYVSACDADSETPNKDVSEATGIPLRRVQAYTAKARDVGLLDWGDQEVPAWGHRQGAPGGELSPAGNERLWRFLDRHFAPFGSELVELNIEAGAAVGLLRYLVGDPAATPSGARLRMDATREGVVVTALPRFRRLSR